MGRPAVAISQAITELEFHISPASSSSRPQTGLGTVVTRSSTSRATRGSLLSRQRVVLLRVTGRRSGREFELPVGYVRDDSGNLVTVGAPEQKQ